MLLVDSILLLSPFVQTSLLAEEKVIPRVSKMCVVRLVVVRVEEDPKSSGRPSDSRGRDRKGKGRGR